jgi:hypothetical protein
MKDSPMPNATHRVSTTISYTRFPKLRAFVEWGIDMQLADVHEMLRLPLPDLGLDAGHNFAAATSLANLIAGASVWFYDASEHGLRDRGDRSRRYRAVLERYWPWDDGEIVSAEEGYDVLYGHVRNPLAHAFGLPDPEDGALIQIEKSPLTEEQIEQLEISETRPAWLGATIEPAASGAAGRAYFVSVPGLYWGVQRLLRGLLTDPEQLPAAEALAGSLVRFLTAPNSPWRRSS